MSLVTTEHQQQQQQGKISINKNIRRSSHVISSISSSRANRSEGGIFSLKNVILLNTHRQYTTLPV